MHTDTDTGTLASAAVRIRTSVSARTHQGEDFGSVTHNSDKIGSQVLSATLVFVCTLISESLSQYIVKDLFVDVQGCCVIAATLQLQVPFISVSLLGFLLK